MSIATPKGHLDSRNITARGAILSAFRRVYERCDALLDDLHTLPPHDAFEHHVALMINHSHFTVPDIDSIAMRAEQIYQSLRDTSADSAISPLVECGYWASAYLSRPLNAQFDGLSDIDCVLKAYSIARRHRLFLAQFSLAGQLATRTCVEGYSTEAMNLISRILGKVSSLPHSCNVRDDLLILILRDSARIQRDSGRNTEAIEFLECAVRLLEGTNSPVRVQIYTLIAQCQVRLGKLARAREALAAVANELREFGDDRVLSAVATGIELETSLMADQMIPEAEARLQEMLAERQIAGWWNLMIALAATYVRLGRRRDALAVLEQAESVTRVPLLQLEIAQLKARCLTELGETTAAIQTLQPTLSIAARRHASPDLMGLLDEFAVDDSSAQHNRRILESLEHGSKLRRLKSELVGSIGHDIQGPLTVLKLVGFNPDYCTEALEAVESINTLMDSLTSVDVPSDKQVEVQVLELKTIIEHAVQHYRPLAHAEGITVEINCPEELCCLADPALLIRIVNNLLSNAIKYSDSGSLIELHAVAISGRLLSLTVRDEGIGIAKEKLGEIFERGRIIPQQITGAQAQSGYGLYICRRLAANMNGSISAYSRGQGQGSSFTLVLPRAPSGPDQASLR